MRPATPRLRALGALVALTAAVVVPARASAACHASANGAHSYDTRLSPRAGRICATIVDVFAGGACAAPPRWSIDMSCDQTSRMAISNNGRLVSILNVRTKRRDLNVIRVSWSPVKYVWANLAKLEGASPLRGEVRLDFDGDALRLKADRTVVIPFEDLRKMISSRAD